MCGSCDFGIQRVGCVRAAKTARSNGTLFIRKVRRSRSDAAVHLFYQSYAQTMVGGKWLCVVVKYAESDAFVVTAYLTDKPKAGEDLWPIK